MRKKRLLILLPFLSMLLSGCDFFDFFKKPTEEQQNHEQEQKQEEKRDFSGISLNDATYTFDGQAHSLSISGTLPEGSNISYGESGNSFTEVGEYQVTVTITCAGYNTLTLTATLTIVPATLPGNFSFVSAQFEYDCQPHSISVTGDIPDEATISYGEQGNTFTMPGEYVITATVSMEGYSSWSATATLTITSEIATESYKVCDFEGLTNNDLYDLFTLEYYGESGWVLPATASMEVYKNQVIGNGTNTMRLNLTHQGRAFKVTNKIKPLPKKYNGIALDTFVDGRALGSKCEIKAQLWFKNLPLPAQYSGYKNTYATYTLSNNVSTNWTHWEIPFDDPSLSIASSATVTAAFRALNLSVEEFSLYIDKVCVILTPNFISNGNIKAYVDNIELIRSSGRVEQRHVKLNNRTYTIVSNDGTTFKLSFDGENSKFETLNLMSNVSFPVTTNIVGDELTLTLNAPGNKSVSRKVTISNNANILEFKEDDFEGDIECLSSISGHLDFESKKFTEILTVDDFESYENNGQGYDSGNIVRSLTSGLRGNYYGDMYAGSSGIPGKIDVNWNLLNATGWPDYIELKNDGNTGKCMKIRNKSDNQVRYMTMGLAFGNALAIGRGSNLSFFVKGTQSQKITFRAWYVKGVTGANQTYEGGDCVCIKDIPVKSEWNRVVIPIDPNREVFGIMITPTKANAYISFDDITIYGEGDPLTSASSFDYYLYNNSNDIYKIDFNDELTSASLIDCANNNTISLDFEVIENNVVFKDHETSGSNLTINSSFDGSQDIVINSVSGNNAGIYETSLVNKTFKKYAEAQANFEDGEGEYKAYVNELWSQENYQSGAWIKVDTSLTSLSNQNGDSKIVSLDCNENEKRITYSPELCLGPVNHLEIDLGNYYFFSSGAIRYKIAILDENNEVVSNVTGNDFASIPTSTSLTKQSFDFETIVGYKIQVTAKCNEGFAVLYVDNLHACFR